MDCAAYGVAKSRTGLSNFHFHFSGLNSTNVCSYTSVGRSEVRHRSQEDKSKAQAGLHSLVQAPGLIVSLPLLAPEASHTPWLMAPFCQLQVWLSGTSLIFSSLVSPSLLLLSCTFRTFVITLGPPEQHRVLSPLGQLTAILIPAAAFILLCLMHSQVLGMRTWTSLGGYYSTGQHCSSAFQHFC